MGTLNALRVLDEGWGRQRSWCSLRGGAYLWRLNLTEKNSSEIYYPYMHDLCFTAVVKGFM